MARRLRPVVVVLVALAAGLAGCGEDERDAAYAERVDAAQREFAARVDALADDISATSSEREDRRTLRRLELALEEVVGELRSIAPPAEVRRLHARLVGALAAYEREVAGVVRALGGANPARLRAAQRDLERATAHVDGEISRTTAAINDALRG